MGVKTYNGDNRNNTKSATKTWGLWWSPWSMTGGLGSDTLKGGEDHDTLYGGLNSWSDTRDIGDYLDGKGGNDRLYGEAGNDTLWGGSGRDTLDGGRDNDQLSGQSGNDRLYGQSGDDYLNGGSGADVLSGGTGVDTMIGGTGNDVYYVDNNGDEVRESANGGIDKVYAAASIKNYTLTDHVENLVVNGSSAPGPRFFARGNDLSNTIRIDAHERALVLGEDGADFLYGNRFGDTLLGGEGNDQLFGNDGYDSLVGGDGYDNLIGGRDSDRLYGQDGNDVLIGVGGSSSRVRERDILNGGDGADKFYLFNRSAGVDYTTGVGGHAVIEDFGRFEDDTIVLDRDNFGEYLFQVEYAAGIGRSDIADTVIYQNGSAIAYVQDVFNLNYTNDIVYE